ncbi:hypothetical protein [Desulfohalovibrio reitneri]|uniref:hypothetical protein n=1 Tax=Desulfohalovibrio reitneri TaxID=1307759 RepID=UPI000B26D3E4|nr:hypothetical protein [Desulfohalovibrio reitneri]
MNPLFFNMINLVRKLATKVCPTCGKRHDSQEHRERCPSCGDRMVEEKKRDEDRDDDES